MIATTAMETMTPTSTASTLANKLPPRLAFDKVGLVGRDKEVRVLLNAIRSQPKKKLNSSSCHGPLASLPKDPTQIINQIQDHVRAAILATGSSSTEDAASTNGNNTQAKDSPTPSPPVPNSTIASAAQNQIRSLVLISGQSGSGKSALVEEVRKSLLPQTACSDSPDQASNNDNNDNDSDTDAPFDGFFATGKCELSTKKEGVPYTGIQSAMTELCEQVASRAQSEVKASMEHQASTEGTGSKRQTLAALVSKGLSMGELALLSHVIPNIEMLTTVKTSHQADGNSNPPGSATSVTYSGLAVSSPPSVQGGCDGSVSLSAASIAGGRGSSISYEGHTQRIKYVLRRFMQILCSYCPVVMAIDDLQWADRASLGLIQSWLLDSRSTSLTIIGLYRSNMLDVNQTLKATLASLEESKRERSIRISKLSVEDLSVDEVAVYLQRLFRVSSHKGDEGDHPDHRETELSLTHVMPLAEIVHGKTAGNMFFIQQYLDSLVKDGLITQNHLPTPPATAAAALPEVSGVTNDVSHAATWAWDVNEITYRSATAGDNIMDLMKMRLQKSASTHWLLSIAACLGATFSTSHVCAVITGLFIHSSHSKFFREVFQVTKIVKEDEIIAMLQTFFTEGLLEKVKVLHRQSSALTDSGSQQTPSTNTSMRVRRAKSVRYAFIHDKVQEAALSMIPTEDQLAELKYRVGEILLYALSENQLDKKIFMIANLLNTRPDLMPSHRKLDRRMKIIMLNHKAGQKAANASAFHLASSYFAMAIDLLPDDHWETLMEESLELYSSAAESHFVTASFAKARSYCKAVVNQDCDILSKVRAHHVLVDISLSETETTEEKGAAEMHLDLLSQLGCNLPSSTFGRVVYVLRGMMATKGTLRRLEREMSDTLSVFSDEHHEAVMKTLSKLHTVAYLTAPGLVPVVTEKAVRLSLKQGITMYSAPALSFQGILDVCVLERFDVAHKCGAMALKIAKASDDRSLDGKVLLYNHVGIHHWTHPYEHGTDQLLEASRLSMSMGDVEIGAWSLYGSLIFGLHTGKSLDSLDEDVLIHSGTMKDFQQNLQHQLALMLWQLVLNLRGASNHTTQLIGDAYNETNEAYDANHQMADAHIMTRETLRVCLAAHFGEYEIGSELAIKSCLNWLKTTPSSYTLPPGLFHSALCCFGMAHKCKPSYYTKHARTFLKILKRWAKRGNPNCIPYIALLDAEKYSLKKQDKKAIEQYDEAIQMTRRQVRIHDQALANERYSAFFARRGNTEKAKAHLEESISLYGQWGANKKVEMLLRQHKTDFE